MKKIAVLTSGGDAPGMNAAIRSVIRMAGFLHCEIVGIHRGYSGLLEEDFRLLTNRDAGGDRPPRRYDAENCSLSRFF